jgi:mannose-1-phosphate guanylyltransferase
MGAQASALLLAAGIGSRLRPLTDVLPKCLMPINGRPLLEYWLALLRDAGIARIVVNLHHQAALVREYVENSPFAPLVTFSPEQALLGTGGTLLANRALLEGGPVLLAHADNLSLFEPRRLLERHAARPAAAVMTMMTFAATNPESCGIVELDAAGMVRAFHEKVRQPPGNLANAAVYVVEPSLFGFLQSRGKSFIDFSTEVIPAHLGRIFTFHNDVYHRDIGTLASLARAQLEYPLAAARPSGVRPDDAWGRLLAKDDRRLAREFERCLGQAYGEAP